jgi:taurine transport system permease protein
MRKPGAGTQTILIVLASCIFLFAAWSILVRSGIMPPVYLPSPQAVWSAFLELAFGEGYKGMNLAAHLGVSLLRIGAAFALAAAFAVPLGLLCGYFGRLRDLIAPAVYFYRPLPPLAYYTLLIIWLGIGEASKIALLFLAGFAPIFLSCLSAVGHVEQNRIIAARTLGASTGKLFVYVIIPSCLPEMLTGLRTALGFIYTTLVAAEMVAAASGIGWMVLDASNFLRSDIIFVGIIVMGITGVLIDYGFQLLERVFVPWKGKGD